MSCPLGGTCAHTNPTLSSVHSLLFCGLCSELNLLAGETRRSSVYTIQQNQKFYQQNGFLQVLAQTSPWISSSSRSTSESKQRSECSLSISPKVFSLCQIATRGSCQIYRGPSGYGKCSPSKLTQNLNKMRESQFFSMIAQVDQ
jgi:hypothetical protein